MNIAYLAFLLAPFWAFRTERHWRCHCYLSFSALEWFHVDGSQFSWMWSAKLLRGSFRDQCLSAFLRSTTADQMTLCKYYERKKIRLCGYWTHAIYTGWLFEEALLLLHQTWIIKWTNMGYLTCKCVHVPNFNYILPDNVFFIYSTITLFWSPTL